MSLHSSIKALVTVSLVSILHFGWMSQSTAQGTAASGLIQGSMEDLSRQAPAQQDEVLRTFQREAHAAYNEAKQACEATVVEQEKSVCLAKARLQFDADMRYAQKRAANGQ